LREVKQQSNLPINADYTGKSEQEVDAAAANGYRIAVRRFNRPGAFYRS